MTQNTPMNADFINNQYYLRLSALCLGSLRQVILF